MRFATICSGIGAPEVAFASEFKGLGWTSVFASEIENFPNSVLKHHFPNTPNYGDMKNYEKWPVTAIDVLVGGTPCQSFSVAGLRKGMADPRGNLALTFLAIVDKYRPTWVVWENVPGVHSSWSDAADGVETEASRKIGDEAFLLAIESGFDDAAAESFREIVEVDQSNDFDCFLAGLEQLGYGVASCVLDAQYFGVPQRRRRVFVVGHIGGQWQRAAAVLFERESLCGNPPTRRQTREGIAPTISARTEGGGGLGTDFDCDGGVIMSPKLLERSAVESTGKTNTHSSLEPIPINMQSAIKNGEKSPNGHGIGNPGDPACTLGANDRHAVAIGIDGGEVGFALRSNPSHSGDKGDGGLNTTMAAGAHPPAIAGSMQVRRLTPRECERLQGFPDNFSLLTEKTADGPRYKALGNSMAVPVMRWIGQQIQKIHSL